HQPQAWAEVGVGTAGRTRGDERPIGKFTNCQLASLEEPTVELRTPDQLNAMSPAPQNLVQGRMVVQNGTLEDLRPTYRNPLGQLVLEIRIVAQLDRGQKRRLERGMADAESLGEVPRGDKELHLEREDD